MTQRWSLGRHLLSFCGSSAVHGVVLGCAALLGVHAATAREPEPELPGVETSFVVLVRNAPVAPPAPVEEPPPEPPRGSEVAVYDVPLAEPPLVQPEDLVLELFPEELPEALPVEQPLARLGLEDVAFAPPALGAGQAAATGGSADGDASGAAAAPPGGTEVGSTPGPSAGTAEGTGTAPPTVRVADLVPPVLLTSPAPDYPDGARRLREQGLVLCRMHVDARGAVTAVDIEESSGHPLLDAAAVERLKTWRFKPATLDGKPIAALVRHRVRFEMAQ